MDRTGTDRAAHQPQAAPPDRTQPSDADLSAACGRTVAVVLAVDAGTTPLRVEFDDPEREAVVCGDANEGAEAGVSVEASGAAGAGAGGAAGAGVPRPLQCFEGTPVVSHAVTTACASQLAGVCVLVGGDDATRQRISQAASEAAKAASSTVDVVAYDAQADRATTDAACSFDLFGLTAGLLAQAGACLERFPQADSLLIMACDQVRITPSHVLDVCRAFRARPALDAVTSWITWLRRTPLLVSRRFLENLTSSPLAAAGPNDTDRPLPSLSVHEVVFGEEKLAANPVVPASVQHFFDEVTLSAREAVRLAHAERTQAAKADDAATDAADATNNKGRSEADRQLLAAARNTVARMEDGLAPGRATELRAADTWARRNARDFPLLNDRKHAGKLAYLDSAATTQRPFCTLQAQTDFDAHGNANVYRGAYELSAQATASLNAARKRLEDFIGAERRQTVFTANASASCNLVAQAWGERNVGAGDLIVTTLAEHHSNMLPWLMLAQRTGARLEYIPVRGDGRLDLNAYRSLLAQKPKLVCVAHISNVLGLVNPVEDMAAQAHEAGARFLLDAAQSLPHLPLDVQHLGADFVAFSAHKMYGPLGIGGLWIAPDAFDEMDPVAGGGGVISHEAVDSYYLRVGAIQYEVGTPPISQAIGWAAAVDYLDSLGMEAVMAHSEALTRYLLDGLHGIGGLTVWGDHSRADGLTGLVAFSLAGVQPAELGTAFGKLGVAIRSGGHCALPLAASLGVVGTGRVSLAVHSTVEDVEAAVTAAQICRDLYQSRLDA